jgi:hypothetical protein
LPTLRPSTSASSSNQYGAGLELGRIRTPVPARERVGPFGGMGTVTEAARGGQQIVAYLTGTEGRTSSSDGHWRVWLLRALRERRYAGGYDANLHRSLPAFEINADQRESGPGARTPKIPWLMGIRSTPCYSFRRTSYGYSLNKNDRESAAVAVRVWPRSLRCR